MLEREGIEIKGIAGSSMGAVVAVAYALNHDFEPRQFAESVRELGVTVPGGLNGDQEAKDSFMVRLRKFIDAERVLLDAALGWGILTDQQAVKFLETWTHGRRLEEARIPVAIVTTDLLSGEKVVFTEGPAALAARASSALPGLMPPVKYDERLLVDGAVVDLVPTDTAREIGGSPVLAVDVDQEEIQVEVTNGVEAFFRAIEVCARHLKNHHLRSADLIIRPDFDAAVSLLDVSKADLCFAAGVRAAEKVVPEIYRLLGEGIPDQKLPASLPV